MGKCLCVSVDGNIATDADVDAICSSTSIAYIDRYRTSHNIPNPRSLLRLQH